MVSFTLAPHANHGVVGFIIQSCRNYLHISQMPNPAESLKFRGCAGTCRPNSFNYITIIIIIVLHLTTCNCTTLSVVESRKFSVL